MKWRGYLWFSLFFFHLANAFAGDGVVSQPAGFLRIGVGARALGMGGAFTAVANDVTAGYWNPAGLGQISDAQLGGMYSRLSSSQELRHAGIAFPLGFFGAVSGNWINLERRDFIAFDEYGAMVETFSNSEHALLLSYGIRLLPFFAVGASFKQLVYRHGDYSAFGSGYDAGALLMFGEAMSIGASLQNHETKIEWNAPFPGEETLPRIGRAGIKLQPASFLRFCGDYEVVEPPDGKWEVENLQAGRWRAGGEIVLLKTVGLRGGSDFGEPVWGASLIIPAGSHIIEVDYAHAQNPLDQSDLHRLGLLLRAGKSRCPKQPEPSVQPVRTESEETDLFSRSESEVKVLLLQARVIEIRERHILIQPENLDVLRQEEVVRIYLPSRGATATKFFGDAEVIKIGKRQALIKVERKPLFVAGDKIMISVAEE